MEMKRKKPKKLSWDEATEIVIEKNKEFLLAVGKQEKDRMKPFHEVVNKIKWSENEKIEDFTVGYYDRVKK